MPNNGMHPTRDTTALINLHLVGGRVMPGVMPPIVVSAMNEKLAGIVQTCEVLLPTKESGPSGLSLRPAEEWGADLVVGSSVRLVLPSGETHRTKIRGGEMWRLLPEGTPVAILVEFLPELDNEVPAGTLVFVDEAA